MSYRNSVGDRIRLSDDPAYGDMSRVTLSIRAGWNDSCPWTENTMSLEEARGLHWLLGRLIANAEDKS